MISIIVTPLIVGLIGFSVACYLGSDGEWPWQIVRRRRRERRVADPDGQPHV